MNICQYKLYDIHLENISLIVWDLKFSTQLNLLDVCFLLAIVFQIKLEFVFSVIISISGYRFNKLKSSCGCFYQYLYLNKCLISCIMNENKFKPRHMA